MKSKVSRILIAVLALLAAVLLCIGFTAPAPLGAGLATPVKSEKAAVHRVQRVVEKRLATLENYAGKAIQTPENQWLEIGSLPEDMVVYRYCADTLQSWAGRFPVSNDALSAGMLFQSLVNPRTGMRSPLSDITEEYSYCNIGPKWYLARSINQGNTRLIIGLEIINTISDRSWGGINPRLRTPKGYSIQPLSEAAGSVVSVKDAPMFKLIYESPGPIVVSDYSLFSPMLYADGRLFRSLGHLLLVSLLLMLPVWLLYGLRKRLPKIGKLPALATALIYSAGLLLFCWFVVRSVTLNSNINLEIYKVKEFTWTSLLVYVMLVALLFCIPMLMRTALGDSSRNIHARAAFSLAAAVFLVGSTAWLGFRKERASLEVWANRLAVTRDISLEMQLRSVEDQIARDPMLASLSMLDNAGQAIRNRIADSYLPRVAQEYDLTVSVGRDIDLRTLSGAEIISPNSRFTYKESSDGLASYAAVFTYNLENYGRTAILLRVEQKGDWRYRGYASILGEASPGEVLIPASYAYARYQGLSLLSFRGNFAYPVKMDGVLSEAVYAKGDEFVRRGGFTHFIYVVADAEAVIVSRRTINALFYGVAGIFVALLFFLGLSLPAERERRKGSAFERGYFSTRLNVVIMASLTLALVSMALVSVFFVYNRNDQNRRTLMTEKIGSIAASISARIRGARTTDDLRNQEVLALIEDVGNSTNSDVTLYDPRGMVFMSTAPAVFERSVIDSRIEPEAYRNIMLLTSRYYIQREKAAGHGFWCMYAPLVGDGGGIIAIICAPYTDDSYEFETGAINHSIMVLSLFMLLMLGAWFMARRVLERMFSPLLQMGRKMEGADLDHLEYIEYDKEDEISSLVAAYNRMVSDLSESSRQLAEAERDKAWSGMARQVAHEIKNPLTPMKLQIQRLVRLKAKGDPAWQERFDEVSSVLLDHIEMLTDTANEFSTFAKLYTEEPTEFDLDALLQEEISMFSGREDIHFDYFGFAGAKVSGPKPQLTRVFVNLINNAVQALDGVQDATIRVSLRNSQTEGYYDIVFEDNGPGVSEENVEKLFTPNFTTKTGGSGLGLAISRSILNKCEATITYSRSFALGGACFTILYPKK